MLHPYQRVHRFDTFWRGVGHVFGETGQRYTVLREQQVDDATAAHVDLKMQRML